MKNSNDKKFIPYASRHQIVLSVTLGCINLIIFGLISRFSDLDPALTAVALVLIYLLEIALVSLRRSENESVAAVADVQKFMSEDSSVVFRTMRSPVVVTDTYGTVLWYNAAMHDLFDDKGNFVGESVVEMFGPGTLPDLSADNPYKIGNRLFRAEGFVITEDGDGLYLAAFSDVTELTDVTKRYEDERVAVAYVAIDNVEDVLQYVHEKFRDAVSAVEDKIKNWARSMNAVIKSYDSDKFIMLLDSSELDKCLADRFSILDSIRDSRVGDEVSITVSIGVSRVKGTLAEREAAARDAIDMALQRGGDQAVYKNETSIEYYGGRTKSVYKRSNVRSRTFTSQLTAMMARADNVLIMGHKYGDFDSIGASVGVARLASLCGIKVNIAVDLRDKNLAPCIEMMEKCDLYSQVFVDSAGALDLVGPDTLLVLVDHNTTARAQFSDIADRINTVAIIDHHRKIDALPEKVKLSYIEPSASSASELVAEMLESAVTSQSLLKEEADILFAGIFLDTKQFMRNTGTRTFGAAQYLRGAGANPSDVYNLFKTDAAELSKEARFHTAINIYRDNIAISCCEGDTDDSYRVIASKAADKMLTLQGIEASFTLVRIADRIHISGRSNGNVNVQLILEKLHGGGHFDVAGAQVASDSITSVLEKLKSSIDEYLES